MGIHPWTSHEIAQSRHQERLVRGMAAYQAERATEERTAAQAEGVNPARQTRLLDRLLRRGPRPAESAPMGM
jgi:hypothetical protein